MKPPPLPEEILRRVLRVAKADGLGLVIIAGLGTLLSLAMLDLIGAFVGAVIVYGGWTELAGRRQLLRGDADGVRRLVRSQLIVLNVILIYCARQIFSFDLETTLGQASSYFTIMNELGFDLTPAMPLIRAYLPLGVYTFYGLVAALTLLYQGGMSLYYRRRADPIQRALTARREPPATSSAVKPGSAPEDFLT